MANDIVDTFAALRDYSTSSAGDEIIVRGANSVWDNGGGVFKRVETGEIVNNGSDAGDGGTYDESFAQNNYPLELIDNTVSPWTYRPESTRIQWEGGAVWTKNSYASAGSTFDSWIMDDSIAVDDQEKGFVLPEVEGWRVVPTFAGYSNDFYWERVVPEGKVTPEMYGAVQSDFNSSSPTDVSQGFQAALDSQFEVELNGGSYYVSSTVQARYQKAFHGKGRLHNRQETYADRFGSKGGSRVWTDQNIRMFNVGCQMDIKNIEFNVENVGATSDITGEAIETGDGSATNFTGSFANSPLEWGSITITDGTETFTDDHDQTLTGDQGGSGTYDADAGTYDITFNTAPSNGQSVTADYTYHSEEFFQKECVNYDASFPINGGSLKYCDFIGNPAIKNQVNRGGIAVRHNHDDADNTNTDVDGSANAWGNIARIMEVGLTMTNFNIAHKQDELKRGETSAATGDEINTSGNTNFLFDVEFDKNKQAVVWNSGSINRIAGIYVQDGNILTYHERDKELFDFTGANVVLDIAIGDQRTGSVPSASDDPSIYPQAHYPGYNYKGADSVTFTGNSMRHYENGEHKRLLGTPHKVLENPAVPGDGLQGVIPFKDEKGSYLKTWMDNQLMYANSLATVTYNALEGGAGFDFEGNLTPQDGTLTVASEITITGNGDEFVPKNDALSLSYNSGWDEDTDFVEVVIDLSTHPESIEMRDMYSHGNLGCKSIQVIYLDSSNNSLGDWKTDYSEEEARTVLHVGRASSNLNNVDKVIIRYIGKFAAASNSVVRFMAANSRQNVLPFLPKSSATHYGQLQLTDLPTSNPGGSGNVWNDGGTLKIT